jgi:hypothetical protein
MADAHEGDQTRPDAADHLAVDPYLRAAGALQQQAHQRAS